MDEVGLGKKLQEVRQAAGFTQQQLCQKAEISYSTLAKIERGAIKSPSVFTVNTIVRACGSSLDALFGYNTLAPQIDKKVAKNGVRFVYFDLNGVLVRFFQRAFTKLGEDTFTTPDVIESIYWHYNEAVCRGDMSFEEFNKHTAKQLGVPSVDWAAYYLDAVDPILETRECIEWAAQHFQIGILTNTMPGLVSSMIQRGILPNIPSCIIIDSSQIGAVKPESKIYEIAAQKAGVKPQEILLIDDSRPNLMAAEKHGWHVLWFEYFSPAESVARIKQTLAFDEKTA